MSSPPVQRSARCRHNLVVCSKCVQITDAAKRMSGHINLRVVCTPHDQLIRSWMAFRLSDGSSDGVLYDTREDAVRHQLHETQSAYFCMRQALGGTNPRDCQIFLNVHRHVYDSGGRFTESAHSLIMSSRGYDILLGRVNPYE